MYCAVCICFDFLFASGSIIVILQLLEDHYVGPILAFLSESASDSTNNDGQGGLRLASALVVISLVVVYKIPLQSDSFSLLCDSLLLRLDSNQSKCSELQILMDRYIANQGEKLVNCSTMFCAYRYFDIK